MLASQMGGVSSSLTILLKQMGSSCLQSLGAAHSSGDGVGDCVSPWACCIMMRSGSCLHICERNVSSLCSGCEMVVWVECQADCKDVVRGKVWQTMGSPVIGSAPWVGSLCSTQQSFSSWLLILGRVEWPWGKWATEAILNPIKTFNTC